MLSPRLHVLNEMSSAHSGQRSKDPSLELSFILNASMCASDLLREWMEEFDGVVLVKSSSPLS